MVNVLYWEDVAVENEIPSLTKVATTQMVIRWAGACGDFIPLHYDHSFVTSIGLPKPVIHGGLKRAWLVQLITDWMGEQGDLKKFYCQYRLPDYPRPMKTYREPLEGETWYCKGRVTKKYIENSEHYVDCSIWVENDKGEVTTPASVTVVLPSRG